MFENYRSQSAPRGLPTRRESSLNPRIIEEEAAAMAAANEHFQKQRKDQEGGIIPTAARPHRGAGIGGLPTTPATSPWRWCAKRAI